MPKIPVPDPPIKDGAAWPVYGTMEEGAGSAGATLPFPEEEVLPVTIAVGAATPALAMDVSFATTAEGLSVGLTEGKAPATLAQRLGDTRMMSVMGEKGQN